MVLMWYQRQLALLYILDSWVNFKLNGVLVEVSFSVWDAAGFRGELRGRELERG